MCVRVCVCVGGGGGGGGLRVENGKEAALFSGFPVLQFLITCCK